MHYFQVSVSDHYWIVRAENDKAAVRCVVRRLKRGPLTPIVLRWLADLWDTTGIQLPEDDDGIMLSADTKHGQ